MHEPSWPSWPGSMQSPGQSPQQCLQWRGKGMCPLIPLPVRPKKRSSLARDGLVGRRDQRRRVAEDLFLGGEQAGSGGSQADRLVGPRVAGLPPEVQRAGEVAAGPAAELGDVRL